VRRPARPAALLVGAALVGAAVLGTGLLLGAAACRSGRQRPPEEPENALTADLVNYRNGLALLKEGRPDEAIALLQRAKLSYPNDPSVWNALGLAILYKKAYPDALKAFDQALYYDPSFVEAHNNKGFTLMEMGRYDDAEKEFRTVLDSPTSREKENARLNLGLLRARQHRWEEAEAQFTAIVSEDPKFLRAYRERGIVRVRRDDFRGGLEDLIRFLKQEPKDGEANYSAALCLLAQGRRDLATRYMLRVVESAPESEEAKKARRFLDGEGAAAPGPGGKP